MLHKKRENRYFVGDTPNEKTLDKILRVCVASEDSIKYSLDKSRMIIKLFLGNRKNYQFLSAFTKLNKKEAKALARTAEFKKPSNNIDI